ncbi:MAG: DUF47 family protein [Candidatus Zixiibacteriota bacterium]
MLFGRSRDDEIQERFERHIGNTVESAELLRELLTNLDRGSEYVTGVVQKLVEMEHVGDRYKAEIHSTVDRSFITRLHKGDIDKLIHEMDRVVDHIKKVALYVRAYRLTGSRAEAVEFCGIVVEMTKLLVGVIAGLAKPQVAAIRETVARIDRLEEEADLLLYSSLATLFESEPDAKAVIQWQGLLEMLEEVTDSCHHVTSVAVSIVRKES